MTTATKTPETKRSAPAEEVEEHSATGGINHSDIFEWQPAAELARKIGAKSSSEINNAATSGYRCRGWNIARRPLTEAEQAKYSGKLEYLTRVTTKTGSKYSKELVRQMAKKDEQLRELEEELRKQQLENDELRAELEAVENSDASITKEFTELLDAVEIAVSERTEESMTLLSRTVFEFYRNTGYQNKRSGD